MSKLILWDIDGTLVNAGQVAADVFDDAIETVTGRRPINRVRMSGKTDPQIALEYLEMSGVDNAEALLPTVMDLLAQNLAERSHLIQEQGHVLPGVIDALDALDEQFEVEQTLLTGNIQPNAWVKLAAFDLAKRFDYSVGAFGSDHIDRRKLVPIALERNLRVRNAAYKSSDVWIIGDSPNDYACAVAGGVRCVLVATGRSTIDELAELAPDLVLSDLSDLASLLGVLQ